jgi:hypothetical protein
MTKPRREFYVHAFPHESAMVALQPEIMEAEDGDILAICVENLKLSHLKQRYELRVPRAFQGMIFMVEGQLLTGGLPRNSRVLLADPLSPLVIDRGRFFQCKPGENEVRTFAIRLDNKVAVSINRYFLFLERGTFGIMLQLKHKSGEPIFLHLDVPYYVPRRLNM